MKTISIVNTDLVALIDDEDFDLVSQHRWYLCRSSKRGITSVFTKTPYKKGEKRDTIYLHRLVTNAPDDKFVDHINRNVLDNRKENLRFCNNQMNCFNRSSTNPTGYKGVFRRNERGQKSERYRSYINVDGKRINLGTYATAKEAAIAYNTAAKEYHGEYAALNEIRD